MEATSAETGRALWDRTPVGPYSLAEARAALGKWEKDTSFGIPTCGRTSAGYTYTERIRDHCDDNDCLIWVHRQTTDDTGRSAALPRGPL